MPNKECGGGGGTAAAAAIRILSELLSFTASSYLVPSLNAASTRSEGAVFHSHLDYSNSVSYPFICFYFLCVFSLYKCLRECKLFLHCVEGMLLTLIRHAAHFSQ
ncbi:hypothetical protein PAHAL_3G265700 [Panicum hallii]|jgi:hypothetical protein|uniref:Uncharacterized protein n=1 Tax=Panicum hallii TaxID=206008 RepID=A0A2T8KJG7_9POAL|nr:hypothetical protein PAHAL_3G265700 [Panicum hallii]